MKNVTILLAVLAVLAMAMPAQAGLFKIDFSNHQGTHADWDTPAIWTSNAVDPIALTDRDGSDNDVTIAKLADASGYPANNSKPNDTYAGDGLVDGIVIPRVEVWMDYLWYASFVLKIENLDAGTYNVSAFLGRTTDSSQEGEIIVTANTVTEMPTTGCTLITNYGNSNDGYPADSPGVATAEGIVIGENETLWFRHLEDGTGGTAGMVVRLIPEPATLCLLGIGGIGVLIRRKRR